MLAMHNKLYSIITKKTMAHALFLMIVYSRFELVLDKVECSFTNFESITGLFSIISSIRANQVADS